MPLTCARTGCASIVSACVLAGAASATFAASPEYQTSSASVRTVCKTAGKPCTQPADQAKTPATKRIPIPRQNPRDLPPSAAPPALSPIEGEAGASPQQSPGNATESVPSGTVHAAVPEDGAACLKALAVAGAQFAPASSPQASNSACTVATPVSLVSARGAHGEVAFPEHPLLACAFALQFTRWVAGSGAIAAITTMATGPGFQCRGRNGDSSAKLSEHAHGDAVDITSFTAGGHVVQVSDAAVPASADFAMLKALRSSACGYFTTVLGPGANAAHAKHFHLDLAQHGRSKDYRICE